MHDLLAVGVVQRCGDRAGDLERLLQREVPLTLETLPQGLPIHKRHHVVEELPGLPRIVQRHDVGMLQPSRDLDLPEEAVGAETQRQLGVQDLDGHRPVVAYVLREIHRRHPTAPDLPVEVVALG